MPEDGTEIAAWATACEFTTADVELSRRSAPRPGPAGDVQSRLSPLGADMLDIWKMAHSLISTSVLKTISSRYAENEKRAGNRHFQMSKPISIDMRRARSVGHRERLVGVSCQAHLRRASQSLAWLSQPCPSHRPPFDHPERGL